MKNKKVAEKIIGLGDIAVWVLLRLILSDSPLEFVLLGLCLASLAYIAGTILLEERSDR